MNLRALMLILLLLPVPALGQEAEQFSNRQAVTLDPGKAYFLVRTTDIAEGGLRGTVKVVPALIRTLTGAELQQTKDLFEKVPDHWKDKAEPNVVVMLPSKSYDENKGSRVLLVAARPGTYVFGGIGMANWASLDRGGIVAALCMGTVKFDARPGIITDLGTILAAHDDRATTIPELANFVRGKEGGPFTVNFDVALRPATAQTPVPDTLGNLPRIAADYHAMGAYPNYSTGPLSRLAPLPGVLDYDKNGDVVDLKAGAEKDIR